MPLILDKAHPSLNFFRKCGTLASQTSFVSLSMQDARVLFESHQRQGPCFVTGILQGALENGDRTRGTSYMFFPGCATDFHAPSWSSFLDSDRHQHQYASVPQGKQWCLRPAKLLHRTSTSWLDSTSFSHLQICSPFCTPAIVWLSTRHNIQNLGQNILFFLHVDGFWSQCLNRCSLGLLPNDSDFWSLEIAVALWSSRLVLSKTTPMGEGPWDCGTSCGHFFPILTAIAVRVDLNGLRNYSVTQVSSKASLNAPLRQPFQKKQVACPG